MLESIHAGSQFTLWSDDEIVRTEKESATRIKFTNWSRDSQILAAWKTNKSEALIHKLISIFKHSLEEIFSAVWKVSLQQQKEILFTSWYVTLIVENSISARNSKFSQA